MGAVRVFSSNGILKQRTQVICAWIELECACLYLRHLQQVRYQIRHAIALGHNLAQTILVPACIYFAAAFLQQTRGKPLYSCQRGTQLMRDNSQQVSLDALNLVLPGRVLKYPATSDKRAFRVSHMEQAHTYITRRR